MPDDIKKEIFELSRLNKIDINKLTQMKTAKAIETAAANPSGTAGAGMGMGMGFAMAQQMGQSMNNAQAAAPASPPPLPNQQQFFVAVNGQQTGPFDMNVLSQMAAQGSLTRESMVWKNGMAAWAAAGQVAELSSAFAAMPPPLPK